MIKANRRITKKNIKKLLENLTGQKAPLDKIPIEVVRLLNDKIGLGFSQFNELLLCMGYDRVTRAFFSVPY